MQRWRNYQVCSCVIAILVLPSCASELARRYQDATWDTTSQPYAMVSIFTLDTPFTPGQRLFLGLSPEGQAAWIEAVKHTTTDTNELLTALVQGWPSGPNRHAIFDHTRFHKRIVVSVEKHETIAVRPADRIEQLRVVLGDLQNGTFVSWDKLSTEYQDVDLGKLTLVKGITGSGQIDAGGVAGVPVSGRAGVTATRNLTEEVSLKQRYEFLTGILQPTQATISRQGVVGIDLTGTFHIDVTLQATHVQEAQIVRMGTLFAPNGDPVAPSQVALSHAWVKYAERPRIEDHSAEPPPAPPVRPITCRIHMPYVFRSVQAHHNTVVEGDDKVHFLVGNASSDARVELVHAHELHATVYAVGLPDGPEVRIGELKGGFGPARFETYDKAQNFVAWLRRQPEALVAGYRIGLVTSQSALTLAPLTTMQREQLAVFPVKLNW